jgi:hypothetical protein
LTTFPTITASGEKLRLCAILKGKTRRCLRKVTENAKPCVLKVRLYYTERGKMNTVTMLAWLQDVVLSYTQLRPCALVLDSYASHFAPDVCALAAQLNIELIQVPPGCTALVQPLDVGFNGPLLAARKRIYSLCHAADMNWRDTWQVTVYRAELAYSTISRETTLAAWRRAHCID